MVSGAAWNWMALWAVAIALGTQALLGFSPFPIADDYSYAPLAEAWADPGLYPRDDLLHGIANHAWAYNAVYWLAKSTIGIGAGFWAATVAWRHRGTDRRTGACSITSRSDSSTRSATT